MSGPGDERRSIDEVLHERDVELDEAREAAVRAGWGRLFDQVEEDG